MFKTLFADIAQVVEHVIGNDEVISANLIIGSWHKAYVAQLVEHRFRKAGVDSSILSIGSAIKENDFFVKFFRAERSSA